MIVATRSQAAFVPYLLSSGFLLLFVGFVVHLSLLQSRLWWTVPFLSCCKIQVR